VTDGPFPAVSVCLLNYRGTPYLDACLDALEALDPRPVEIIVVDNDSPDGSGARIKERGRTFRGAPIRFVAAGGNLGYAAGHDLGASFAQGEYLAFLNITVVPEPGWLEVVRWMERTPDVAFVQPAIFHRKDPQRVESLGTILRRTGRLEVIGRNLAEAPSPPDTPYVGEVLSILGAIFVARRRVFEELGGFDRSMFMYFEESDLCWRGWLTGHRSACWFDPTRPTRAYHVVHGTHPKGFDVRRYFERNRTLTMFRNLEGRRLGWLVPNAGMVAMELWREPRCVLRYGKEVFERLPVAAEQRRAVQRRRTVGDARIFGLQPPPDLSRWFRPRTAPSA
jgi:GT2 family glycosyltransferase